MKTVLIAHGALGTPREHWFLWLARELKKSGYKVIAPQFPIFDHTLTQWKTTLLKKVRWQQEMILVGHSLGAPLLLHMLEQKQAKATYLVGGFCSILGNPRFDPLIQSFVVNFPWEGIRSHCPRFVVYHSDNDPYVPLEKGEELASNVGVKLTLIKGAGHFNDQSGYDTFPRLLSAIKKV